MKKINVLYISGSLGMGHITRDIAIAAQLRKLIPEIEIEWLAADPATKVLMEAGEKLVPGFENYADENLSAEKASQGASLNILRYLMKSRKEWKQNIDFFIDLIQSRHYDLVIGDETYEINLGLRENPKLKTFPFVMIFDFVGLEAMTKNPLERLGVYYWNRVWCHDYRKKQKPPYDLGLFVGEPEDVPDISFGFGLPNRREFAKAMYTFAGYIFPFDVGAYKDKDEVKRKLGYGTEPLVICSIGGTSIGREMLELCGEAFLLAKRSMPDIRMVIVTGPRLSPESLKLPAGIEVKGFVPRLYEHFAASDLAIVQGGATSTLELSALRIPFIYFPIEGHCEQANVARMLDQHGAGVRLTLSQTTSALLAEKIITLTGSKVTYSEINVNGAQKAAQSIFKLLRA